MSSFAEIVIVHRRRIAVIAAALVVSLMMSSSSGTMWTGDWLRVTAALLGFALVIGGVYAFSSGLPYWLEALRVLTLASLILPVWQVLQIAAPGVPVVGVLFAALAVVIGAEWLADNISAPVRLEMDFALPVAIEDMWAATVPTAGHADQYALLAQDGIVMHEEEFDACRIDYVTRKGRYLPVIARLRRVKAPLSCSYELMPDEDRHSTNIAGTKVTVDLSLPGDGTTRARIVVTHPFTSVSAWLQVWLDDSKRDTERFIRNRVRGGQATTLMQTYLDAARKD